MDRDAILPRKLSSAPAPVASPAEIVASKLSQFARQRRDLAEAIARRRNVQVPDDVQRFFAAVEGGRWEEIDAAFKVLSDRKKADPPPQDLVPLWGPILESLGAAESAHDWPAQKLLDYGSAILGSLKPGSVYLGGTDPGRFIPTLLNDTTDGEHHVIVTQNGLADGSYLDYLHFLYSDRIATLTHEDSDSAFADYLADARKRFDHDQQFPDEPKQLRPGEDVHVTNEKTQVSGQVAVMAINERLVQMLMQKNPDMTFAIEQSFPLKSTYGDATPVGPIMELRVQDQQQALTADRAAQSVNYWRDTEQQILSDPESAASPEVRKTYSKMAAEQGALFLDRNYPAQAEEAFRIAAEICPYSPEAVYRYANILVEQKRFDEAIQLAQTAINADSDHRQEFPKLLSELRRLSGN